MADDSAFCCSCIWHATLLHNKLPSKVAQQKSGVSSALQVGGGHLQSPAHRNTSLPQSPSADPRLCAESSVVRHSSAGPAFHFAGRAFRLSAHAVWNSLSRTVLESTSLTVFKFRLKTHLFHPKKLHLSTLVSPGS